MKTDLTLAICMYNAEKYIEETLLCIMAQTKQDFFLMIINDCSTDSSADVVKSIYYGPGTIIRPNFDLGDSNKVKVDTGAS